jgi:signal transduction histidine kinase
MDIEEKLKAYAISVFLIESGIVVFILLLFYYTAYRYIKREEDTKDLLNILLLALTHRLGNFLASQKVNLELMDDSLPARRLRESLSILEKAYENTMKAIESLRSGQEEHRQSINMADLLLDVALLYGEKAGKDIRLQVNSGVRVRANYSYLKMLIDLLIDNAVKYSGKRVYIRLLNYKGRNILVVRNDMGVRNSESREGSGMGLRIAKFISDKLGFDIRIRTKGTFTVIVCM